MCKIKANAMLRGKYIDLSYIRNLKVQCNEPEIHRKKAENISHNKARNRSN